MHPVADIIRSPSVENVELFCISLELSSEKIEEMEKVDNQDDPSAKRLRVETGEEQKPAVPSNSIVKLNVGGKATTQ